MSWNNVWKGNNLYSNDTVRNFITNVKMNHISNLLNQNYKFQNIVEIGCGDGKMLFELSKKYNSKSIIGIDISTEALKLANQSARTLNIESNFLIGTADNIPLPECSADFCFSLGVIEHYNETQKIFNSIKEMKRILKPGGIAVVMVPNYYSIGVIDRKYQQRKGTWIFGFQQELKRKFILECFNKSEFIGIKSNIEEFVIIPGIRKPINYYIIHGLDKFMRLFSKEFGFYLYTMGIKGEN